jgi:hypothetical protein
MFIQRKADRLQIGSHVSLPEISGSSFPPLLPFLLSTLAVFSDGTFYFLRGIFQIKLKLFL